MDRGAWWVTVHVVTELETTEQLKQQQNGLSLAGFSASDEPVSKSPVVLMLEIASANPLRSKTTNANVTGVLSGHRMQG